MIRSKKVPERRVRAKVGAFANCEERAVKRYYEAPNRVHPALQDAIKKALPLVGLSDPHAEAQL
jgi:hypothetical protein